MKHDESNKMRKELLKVMFTKNLYCQFHSQKYKLLPQENG